MNYENMNIHLKHVIGGGYDEFVNSRKRYRIVKGSRASKKSKTSALFFIYSMMKFYHLYGVKPCLLVIRRYHNTHKTSTRAELQFAINRLGVGHLWHIPKGELTLTYIPSGQTIIFRGMDNVDSLTSITVPVGHLCWCWCEEFYQIHSETDFNKLDMSIRGNVPAPLYKQITGTMNAWSDLTWIKPRFFDVDDPDIFTLTTTYMDNEFLGQDDYSVFSKMKQNNPRRYKVEGLGLWGNSEGLIYAGYVDDPEKNHVECPASGQSKIDFITVGLDYGTGTQDSKLGKTCLAAVAIADNWKKAYCIKESYFDGHFLPESIVKWTINFLVELKYSYETNIILHCEWANSKALNNALILALHESGIEGVTIETAYKGHILDRIDLCQILLGEQRLLFTQNVPGTKKAFSTALWDIEKGKLKGAPIRRDDGTSDIDILDCVEYALNKYAKYLLIAGK